jgi:hypothetical protein
VILAGDHSQVRRTGGSEGQLHYGEGQIITCSLGRSAGTLNINPLYI